MHEDGFVGRIEWAVTGRALPGQDVSGDHFAVLDTGEDTALFAVLDGLGHGRAAANAVERATQVLADHREDPLDTLLWRCHRALSRTRGAAVSLARFGAEQAQWLGVGNVESQVLTAAPTGPTTRATALLTGGIVGFRLPPVLRAQTVAVRPGDLLLMATDGVVPENGAGVDLAKSVSTIVTDLLSSNAKGTDDALVLAARLRGPTELQRRQADG